MSVRGIAQACARTVVQASDNHAMSRQFKPTRHARADQLARASYTSRARTRAGRRPTCAGTRETAADLHRLLSALVIVRHRWSLSRGLSADCCGLPAD
jgi:alkanesulfonate monooxygenase SsuD/methylene tetrahydromethanopterin reductase-like flavin-dependent oxidoreductase (luciferase family)